MMSNGESRTTISVPRMDTNSASQQDCAVLCSHLSNRRKKFSLCASKAVVLQAKILEDVDSFVLSGFGYRCKRVLNGSPPRKEADKDANGRAPPSDLCRAAVWKLYRRSWNIIGAFGTLATGILLLLELERRYTDVLAHADDDP
jgi:hypothetical protein